MIGSGATRLCAVARTRYIGTGGAPWGWRAEGHGTGGRTLLDDSEIRFEIPETDEREDPVAPRIMLYSHDTYGLGHIRRARTIAMALAARFEGASILIATGSPIVGRFDFPPGVDFVRIPGVVKLPSGDYASESMHLDIAQTVALRERILRTTAEAFEPDLTIVDKEPTGLRGEMLPTLDLLKARGARIVLGLRDVLDEASALKAEWARKGALDAIERYYDEIWVYGLREIFEPLAGVPLSVKTEAKLRYTGYLRREAPGEWPEPNMVERVPSGSVLVTPGGGGDGDVLIDWVLRAYESDARLSVPALIVFGPFLNAERRAEFERRAHRFRTIRTRNFDSRLERLMIESRGVIAMGGYNTFCEILSFDKPAAIAPRITPRMEQYLRVAAAEKIGLVRMLPPVRNGQDRPDPAAMVDAIRAFGTQPLPSEARIDGLLDGLDRVTELTRAALAPR